MKNILLYILLLLFLASCSQGRYGHVPKVKRGETKQVYKPVTKKKTQPTEIANNELESNITFDSLGLETAVIRIDNKDSSLPTKPQLTSPKKYKTHKAISNLKSLAKTKEVAMDTKKKPKDDDEKIDIWGIVEWVFIILIISFFILLIVAADINITVNWVLLLVLLLVGLLLLFWISYEVDKVVESFFEIFN